MAIHSCLIVVRLLGLIAPLLGSTIEPLMVRSPLLMPMLLEVVLCLFLGALLAGFLGCWGTCGMLRLRLPLRSSVYARAP